MRKLLAVTALSLALSAVDAQAATVLVGSYSGNECGGRGGFSNCYASASGTAQGASLGASPAIFKYGSDGTTEVSSLFPTITGSEFDIDYLLNGNTLSFTYAPGVGDPTIHYFAVKQANGFSLFYDSSPITSGSVNLSDYFPNNPGYSHITFFDTGSVSGVPEPSTWAMLLIGFFGLGGVLRLPRRKSKTIVSCA